jgi:hypothetical protein
MFFFSWMVSHGKWNGQAIDRWCFCCLGKSSWRRPGESSTTGLLQWPLWLCWCKRSSCTANRWTLLFLHIQAELHLRTPVVLCWKRLEFMQSNFGRLLEVNKDFSCRVPFSPWHHRMAWCFMGFQHELPPEAPSTHPQQWLWCYHPCYIWRDGNYINEVLHKISAVLSSVFPADTAC